jgi:hypothetical protein
MSRPDLSSADEQEQSRRDQSHGPERIEIDPAVRTTFGPGHAQVPYTEGSAGNALPVWVPHSPRKVMLHIALDVSSTTARGMPPAAAMLWASSMVPLTSPENGMAASSESR